MAAITFDTFKFANRLKAAGAESRLAEAEAEALMEDRLNERLDARLIQLEQRMTIKLGGLIVVAIGAVATLVKIL
jgi:hypothetical protein